MSTIKADNSTTGLSAYFRQNGEIPINESALKPTKYLRLRLHIFKFRHVVEF